MIEIGQERGRKQKVIGKSIQISRLQREGNGSYWKVIEGNRKNVENSEGNEGNGGNIKVMAPYNRHDPKMVYIPVGFSLLEPSMRCI